MFHDNVIPRSLLLQAHDLSEYLGHIENVSATIDIRIGNSHFYFNVDRYCEIASQSNYQQSRKVRKKTPSDYRRDSFRRNNYEEKRYKDLEKHSENLKVTDIKTFDSNEKLLLDCSFVSDSPLSENDDKSQENSFPDVLNQEISIENMEIIENSEKSERTEGAGIINDNSSENTEVAITKPIEFINEKLSQETKATNKNIANNEKDLIPPPLSPIKSPEQSFQSAKKSRKKEKKTTSKSDFKFYVCDKNKKSAETNVKLTLNWFEKFMGANIFTAPILLGSTSACDHHFAFATKVKDNKTKELIKHLQTINLSSRNVIGVQVDDAQESLDLKNTRHFPNCGYPGDGPI